LIEGLKWYNFKKYMIWFDTYEIIELNL
jgi:hypothetical protein